MSLLSLGKGERSILRAWEEAALLSGGRILPAEDRRGDRRLLAAAGLCPMTNAKDPKRAMDSSPVTSSSAAGPVTFSQVFGQQCQLMEAGKRGARAGTTLSSYISPPGLQCRSFLPSPVLFPKFFPKPGVFQRESWSDPCCVCTPASTSPKPT